VRNSSRSALFLAALSTYLFWAEYLPPFTRVHLHSDIEGFHWPLFVAAFEAVRHGRLPLWDPSIYCGIPFAGNMQAALFYPPTWLLFIANVASKHVLFKTLEAWVFLHGGLALALAFIWLRNRKFTILASVLGAFVFAFGGYMVSQTIHVGVVTGYAWTPLAWLGIDQSLQSRSWRPMWKVLLASALCFLAGYPASFTAFAVGATAYAAGRSWRAAVATAAAIAGSFALSAIALVPAAESAALKTFDPKYGPGIWDPLFYVHFAVPDWVGLKFGDPHMYLYLGVPALFGIPWLIKRPDRAVLAVLAPSILFVTDPCGLVSAVVSRSRLLVQVFSNYSFVEPATLVFAFAAANGVDSYLRLAEPSVRLGRIPRWLVFATVALLLAWPAYRLSVWPRPVPGWWSLLETGLTLLLFYMGLAVIRRSRPQLAILLCAAVFVDYKVCGTSHPFSSVPGDLDLSYPRGAFGGVDSQAFDSMRDHPDYRVGVDSVNATDLRRYGLASPQGSDPLITVRYKSFIERHQSFRTNRLFDIPPDNENLLKVLGVRYFLTREGAPFSGEVESNTNFRIIGNGSSFIRVYEYANALPEWRWMGAGAVARQRWEPEFREFRVSAQTPGQFVLNEQFYPGWRASVDGRRTRLDPWDGVFQSVSVPSGSHLVRFEYRPASLYAGAAISAASLIGLAMFAAWKRPAG
jgi:hypothetical protein